MTQRPYHSGGVELSIWILKIKRALTLLAVWSLGGYCAFLAWTAWQEYGERRQELSAARAEYKQRLEHYGQVLAEGESLRGDEQYQKDLLKKRFGYTEPDETPIVIVRDNASHDDTVKSDTP